MDLEYDRKFEEMKKYIPFLESMITRLESTSLSSNPRQAQLDKIRSLRDLLLDKKKRMKMENLLKCEQVLVNLYAKVEQRDSLTGVLKVKEDSVFSIDSPTPKEKSELEAVRNKLKNVAKIQEGLQDTLPEIARASEVEEVCTSGKEPALFQRRPNKSSISPTHHSPSKNIDDTTKFQGQNSKRNYTRVLVSPEPSSRRWSPSGKPEEKPLFSRRSPRRSPRRYSPSYHKRERKKSSKESNSQMSTGINIMLNVPQESLNSLNTRDILPRIMNCSDGDVDIDTLRELRKQILGELKKTGANDDISDLILKSYDKKQKTKKKEEVEEGELSDSESEAIENIYGSLVVKDQNNLGQSKNTLDKANRKIQICLVINSDKEQAGGSETVTSNKNINATDFEMYNKDEATEKVKKSKVNTVDDEDEKNKQFTSTYNKAIIEQSNADLRTPLKQTINETTIRKVADTTLEFGSEVQKTNLVLPNPIDKTIDTSTAANVNLQLHSQEQNTLIEAKPKDSAEVVNEMDLQNILDKSEEVPSEEKVPYKANFYKPLIESISNETKLTGNLDDNKIKTPEEIAISIDPTAPSNSALPSIEGKLEKMECAVEIPLLNEPTIAKQPAKSVVSEIDILQALKNDILSESICIPGSETNIPLLHQPKVIQVAKAQEILPKKRISIEKYKEKSVIPLKTYSLADEPTSSWKEDQVKKSKIKLTDKECERFNIPKITFDDEDSLDDGDKEDFSVDEIYSNLAPKSPDHDESSNVESIPPVIIPADRVKTVTINHKADVDMRSLISTAAPAIIPSPFGKQIISGPDNENKIEQNYIPPLTDPRVRRDHRLSNESPSPHVINPEGTPRPVFVSSTPNVLPNRTPVMTPNARSYEMTPSHQTFDVEQGNRKHVYAPSFSALESPDMEKSLPRESRPRENPDSKGDRRSRLDDPGETCRKWEDRGPRGVQRDVSQKSRYSESFGYNNATRNDRYDKREERHYSRADCPLTPLPSFGRSDAPGLSVQTFAPMTHVPFPRGECPTTPIHPFGRTDCPTTPVHPFGRSDCPTTPIHPFGRIDCPLTTNHPFGRSECPTTPIHPFGRSDGQQTPNPYVQDSHYNHNMFNRMEGATTPNHSFGRSERPLTPSHPFGRSDKTTNQSFGRSDYNSKFTKDPRLNRNSEYESNKDRGYNRGSSYKPHPQSYGGSDSYRHYEREKSMSRGEKYSYYADKSGRHVNRDQSRFEHDRSMSRDYDSDRHGREKSSIYENETSYEEVGSRRYQRERSVGRGGRPNENYRSTSRAPSVGRAEAKAADNKFSVKPDAGRSFTIDTSVNTTFQKLIESGKGIQVFDYSFDARRQRASSVGRTLVRESSVGRTLLQDVKPNDDHDNKKDRFRRASSVGRNIVVSKSEKSLQEIKADFAIYKSSTSQLDLSKSNKLNVKPKNSTEPINHNRKLNNEKEKRAEHSQSTASAVYLPRKNTRDPRMVKKMNYKDPRTRREEKAANEARRKSSGIDYSSDNIAKGTVLGSGCGVKNYKIPKIKRPVEEKIEEIDRDLKNLDKKEPETDRNKKTTKVKKQGNIIEAPSDRVKEKTKEKVKEKEQVKVQEAPKIEKPKRTEKAKSTSIEIPKDRVKVSPNVKTDESVKMKGAMIDIGAESNDSIASKSDDNVERRVTRSSTKGYGELKSPESSPIKVRTKKSNRNILHDTDSDSENVFKSNKDNVKIGIFETEKNWSPIKHKTSKIDNDVDLDSSFGMDELEMFHDNAVSDPVIDNINALIADLDNDIDTPRNENSNDFTKEITLENMFDSINSPEDNDSNSADKNISVVPETAISATEIQNDISLQHSNDNRTLTNTETDIGSIDTFCGKEDDEQQATNSTITEDAKNNTKEKVAPVTDLQGSVNEDIVSTTHVDPKVVEDISKINEHNTDSCSTPDSTINTDENVPEKLDEEGLVDSTNEVHNETIVTSTDSLEAKVTEEASTLHKQTPALDSIGSLLSLLQDRSKIKEVLSMLGGQSSDNEKIKKKLEKLSEIMSDEEGDNKDEVEKETPIDKEQTSVSNVDDNSVTNVGEGSTLLEDSIGTNRVEFVEENGDNTLRKEEIVNKVSPTEQASKESHDITAQNVDDSHINIEAEVIQPQADDDEPVDKTPKPKKRITKKSKFAKKGKGKQPVKKIMTNAPKRVTRAANNTPTIPKIKKPSRELLKLQEDIKEMFIRDDVLSSTGIRMCRIAKLVDDKNPTAPDNEPVVVLEKFKNMTEMKDDTSNPDKVKRKKPGPKPKVNLKDSLVAEADKSDISLPPLKYKPGPKSKTKQKKDPDPYAFETESVETNTEKASDDDMGSDSESSSVASSRSFGSTECLADMKKKTKRKRRCWQAGVIKPKYKKKKVEPKASYSIQSVEEEISRELVQIPDKMCFTDRTYCFRKNVAAYGCRLCPYAGNEIVHHYKKQHPHIEIPLSRMAPMTAKLAIEQCTEINFQAICKIPSEKYVCIFCYQEFVNKTKSVLETFFWHIVSTHTGEYKQLCTECVQDSQCPFTLDIPSPPKDAEAQLIGYICKKCNFTQISLENIKTHVIVRHNDEQTAVYTINLSVMSKKGLNKLLRNCNAPGPARVLRSCRSNQSLTEASDECSDVTETSSRFSETESVEHKETEDESLAESKPLAIQSKITFEGEDKTAEPIDSKRENQEDDEVPIKTEQNISEPILNEEPEAVDSSEVDNVPKEHEEEEEEEGEQPQDNSKASDDIVDYPHFKISFTESGAKEYICCINRQDRHFKTTLLISMKKHVQMKHSENWDGYCYICKVIVTPQGAHCFKDCLQHYLDKHMDSFPVLKNEVVTEPADTVADVPAPEPPENASTSKTFINVRPLSQLISKVDEMNFPKIDRVVSLGAPTVEAPRPSPNYPPIRSEKPPLEKQFKYEEAQADVMSNKHRVVLDSMMTHNKLINIYKCAGRFCSFTTDSAEDALLHASTHQRIGGVDALNCSYCDFDSAGNAIDLVMHVFKSHGSCQYSCGQCFYRAAASQLVGAHMARMHASMAHQAVLRTTTATTPVSEAYMLIREQAVQYYVCAHTDQNEIKCKFRTYTPDKFTEHLQQRHSTATSHPCYFGCKGVATARELVEHLKVHGLRLYQCTWCVHGADTESDLLAHVSSNHPSKQPQAYLRIITNKDGSNELRVLPLAFLNKTKILTVDVAASGAGQDPVREAERSIELERLIGHANLIAEAASQSIETSQLVDDPSPNEVSDTTIENHETDDLPIPEREPTPIVLPPHVTPPRTATPHDISLQKTPILKSEPPDTSKEYPDDIVVLDSDEDEQRPGVIDLSGEDATTSGAQKPSNQYKKIPLNMLFRCPKCKILCKAIHGLKKHMTVCLPVGKCALKCPHCELEFSDRGLVYTHYMMDHRDATRHECGVCGLNFTSLMAAKKHVKIAHRTADVDVSQNTDNGAVFFTVSVPKRQRVQPKRKLSGPTPEAPVAKRRYWSPEEVDNLPINPILDQSVYCSLCEFNTKVRLNMVRHLQMHADQQPVPQTAPVNPVPHLETNEKHFDKMVNLASSSLRPERAAPLASPASTLVPPEAASRYPRHVPDRQRLTCGARGCSYISVDEQMLRIHWETLHSGTTDYHCVHCPPYQHLDTSKPLTASRILAHLKMHDVNLYACSACCYYHYKREALEKHLSEVHKGGKLMIVREEGGAAPPAALPSPAAPTMDLKPWQCGLCKFKSMLRPAVIEHCAKFHQSKMQYKCAYCPFRTSAIENINKHQTNSHPGKPEDVFYYYYREDCVPDEPDGTPRWQRQRQKCGITESLIKSEPSPPPEPEPATGAVTAPTPAEPANTTDTSPTPLSVDLNLVKKEAEEVPPGMELDIEDLCEKFGQFCEPNGLHYTCPLCKVVAEDSRDAMQCHLYEELKYRRWGCGLCSYKAFHKNGLNDHISSEHRRQYTDPIKLPVDINMEKWVTAHLDHQQSIIDKNKGNLAKLKQAITRSNPGPSHRQSPIPDNVTNCDKYSVVDLEAAFGPFGGPNGTEFCCSKCKFTTKDEGAMKDHLESELTKIRWCCSVCTSNFQTYHEAQFHVKSHVGEPARPREAARDPALRAAWLATAISTQKQAIKAIPSPTTPLEKHPPEHDNSLLVVRYEENVITPDDTLPVRRKRAAPSSDAEAPTQKKGERCCPYCDYKTKYSSSLTEHIPKHFNLKPFTCSYCDFSSYRQAVVNHIERCHPGFHIRVKHTEIPPELIANFYKKATDDDSKLICLHCEKAIPDNETGTHAHDNIQPEFAKKGDVVVKCCICLVLRIDMKSLQEHHNTSHPNIPINYALFKLLHDTRETNYCGYCQKGFKYIRDLKTHHNAVHYSFPLMYTLSAYARGGSEDAPPTNKRCARKSTTKLPNTNSVAKKSTTKLPNYAAGEYSYYNTQRTLDEYANVTALVSVCNTVLPFTFKKLKEFINVEPTVLVKDIQSEMNDSSDD